jgi:hypothetical protein
MRGADVRPQVLLLIKRNKNPCPWSVAVGASDRIGANGNEQASDITR